MVGLLRRLKDIYIGAPPAKGVIQDLEYAMRTKETNYLGIHLDRIPLGSEGFVQLLLKETYSRRWNHLAYGCAYVMGRTFYRVMLHECPVVVLNTDMGRMKMELANIILTKNSDDVYLVEAVKRHFFAEHLFDDLHQDQPLFRWHPHRSYTNSAFVERMKEIEATNSDDEARSQFLERQLQTIDLWET